jgi:putative metallopeptidase DUF4344
MKCLAGVAAFAFATASVIAGLSPAVAQAPPPDLFNPQIEIEYVEPKTAEFAPIYERLVERKVLETLRQFLAPLKLPRKLTVRIDECGANYRRYSGQAVATVCYELIGEIERLAPVGNVQLIQTQYRPAIKAEAGIIGPFVQSLLHEIALAVFDILEVPVWGRQDDAADRVAALIMLQFSKDNLAWNTIIGTAWFLAGSALARPDLADVRGVMAQRYYTTLCIAVGGDSRTFGSFVAENRSDKAAAAGDLPPSRARGCREEYEVLSSGFQSVMTPHLDQALVRRVRSITWINFNESK